MLMEMGPLSDFPELEASGSRKFLGRGEESEAGGGIYLSLSQNQAPPSLRSRAKWGAEERRQKDRFFPLTKHFGSR